MIKNSIQLQKRAQSLLLAQRHIKRALPTTSQVFYVKGSQEQKLQQVPPSYTNTEYWDNEVPTSSQQTQSLEGDFADEAPYITREMSAERISKEFPNDTVEKQTRKKKEETSYKSNKGYQGEWDPELSRTPSI